MEHLKAIPSWVLLAVGGYLAVIISYALYDGRGVDFWPPSIHAKDKNVKLEDDHRYIAKVNLLNEVNTELLKLRESNDSLNSKVSLLTSKNSQLQAEINNSKPKPDSCIRSDGKPGRVELDIGIFNKDKTSHGHGEDGVRSSGKWLISATQLSKVKSITSTWGEKRFGARWKCIP